MYIDVLITLNNVIVESGSTVRLIIPKDQIQLIDDSSNNKPSCIELPSTTVTCSLISYTSTIILDY